MRELEILRPESVDEAARLLQEHGWEAKLIAGGTALVLMYTQGLIRPRYLVSLERVRGLDEIRYEPGTGLRIGALTSHWAVEHSALVQEKYPVLADVFHKVANIRVRNQATVGGVLAEADYASDPPAVFIALDAYVNVVGVEGSRSLPVSDLVQGFYETSLAEDEIITEVVVPEPANHAQAAYLKFVSRSSEDRPCVGIAAYIDSGSNGKCQALKVVVGAAASRPQRFPEVEKLAEGQRLNDALLQEIGRSYADAIDPMSDMRGSAWYRKQVIAALIPRTIRLAQGDQGSPVSRQGVS